MRFTGPVARAMAAFTTVPLLVGLTAGSATTASAATPQSGGTLTLLANAGEWPTLDPAGTGSQPAADVSEFSAVYGQLFEAGPNNSITPGEAAGWKTSDHGLQVDISLRPGMTFQDGTPFNAAAVVASIKRDLAPSVGCTCTELFAPVSSFTAPSALDVQMKLKSPDAGLIASFVDNAPNYTVSPTALKKEGPAKFGQDPVGAGPFEVVSNAASSKLVMKKFPHYYLKGRPYLDGLTITATTSDQTDIEALETGEGQMTGVTTIPLFQQAAKNSELKTQKNVPSTLGFIRLNALKPPFNNPVAREAVAYATDSKAIVEKLYGGEYTPVQGWTAPGMKFFQPKVPGYKAYDLAKAKALVKQLGGLSVTIQTTANTQTMLTETEAIGSQWKAAGIDVKIQENPLTTTITNIEHGNWMTFDAAWGCVIDPSTCIPQNLASTGLFTGSHDKTLDGLIAKGLTTQNPEKRATIYHEINQRLDSQDEIVPLYATGALLVMRSNVHGAVDFPTALGYEDWDRVWLS